jgi:hypothetical protein
MEGSSSPEPSWLSLGIQALLKLQKEKNESQAKHGQSKKCQTSSAIEQWRFQQMAG